MAIETIAENSANRENYEQNESDLDRAIEAIAELKTKDPTAAKKINNLEAQFEQAIRLRRMRIETLESHISDRDDELVEYRRHMEARYRNERKLRVAAILLTGIALALAAIAFIPEETLAVFVLLKSMGHHIHANLPQSPLVVCVGTVVLTTVVNYFFK